MRVFFPLLIAVLTVAGTPSEQDAGSDAGTTPTGCPPAEASPAAALPADGVPLVELRRNEAGAWRFFVQGEEFPLHGAGGATGPGELERLKAAGGNCVRTWDLKTLEKEVAPGKRFIDQAWELGIMVVPGIWLQHERHLFDYSDPEFIRRQRKRVLEGVRRWKDHPAILAWGLGNEMEGPMSPAGSEIVFREVNELARLVKREDPHHPVMTIIALSPAKIPNVMKHCPDIDILGVNSYGGAAGAGEMLKSAGWSRPFAVTEFGVRGFWEVPATPWGAPYEPTSQEKARTYYATHRLVFEENPGHELCLGTFAFLWGWKQEHTATWFGMLLPTGEKLPQVDAMTKAWTGGWPDNRSPVISAFHSPVHGGVTAPGADLTAAVEVEDPEGDPLTYDWHLAAESTDKRVGGEAEEAPPVFPELLRDGDGPTARFRAPDQPGAYRIFLVVRDGQGGAATANLPFRVAP